MITVQWTNLAALRSVPRYIDRMKQWLQHHRSVTVERTDNKIESVIILLAAKIREQTRKYGSSRYPALWTGVCSVVLQCSVFRMCFSVKLK